MPRTETFSKEGGVGEAMPEMTKSTISSVSATIQVMNDFRSYMDARRQHTAANMQRSSAQYPGLKATTSEKADLLHNQKRWWKVTPEILDVLHKAVQCSVDESERVQFKIFFPPESSASSRTASEGTAKASSSSSGSDDSTTVYVPEDVMKQAIDVVHSSGKLSSRNKTAFSSSSSSSSSAKILEEAADDAFDRQREMYQRTASEREQWFQNLVKTSSSVETVPRPPPNPHKAELERRLTKLRRTYEQQEYDRLVHNVTFREQAERDREPLSAFWSQLGLGLDMQVMVLCGALIGYAIGQFKGWEPTTRWILAAVGTIIMIIVEGTLFVIKFGKMDKQLPHRALKKRAAAAAPTVPTPKDQPSVAASEETADRLEPGGTATVALRKGKKKDLLRDEASGVEVETKKSL